MKYFFKHTQSIFLCLAVVTASSTHAGVNLGDRIGINFNNNYADSDTKTDWLELRMDPNDTSVTQTIRDLSMTVEGGYNTFRIGFSRSMAADPTDLNQWLNEVEEVINGGNTVLVAGWFQGDITDAVGDAALWKTVVDEIETRGLTHGITGWEIQNEPAASNSAWRDYMRQIWKNAGPHGNVGWANLTQAQRDATADAWNNKPIVVQGTIFGQRFNSTLVDGLDGINDLVWSVHDYSKFSNITTERENWTVEEWSTHFIDKWTDQQSLLNDNYIVTEIGTNNSVDPTLTGLGPAGTTSDDRRDAGFVHAAEQRYGEQSDTTVYWYTAYNNAGIGVGDTAESEFRIDNHLATNYVFNSQALFPDGPDGTVNVALGKPVTTDSVNGSNFASLAVDGNKIDNSSRWLSANSAADHWIEIDLEDAYEISQFRFWTGFNEYKNATSDFRFERFVNGTWEPILTETGNNNPVYSGTFAPVAADRVRLYSTAGTDNILRLFEIEVYGTEAKLPGDFNDDGLVNALDFTVWRNNIGGPPSALQNNVDDGLIGQAHYLTWSTHYGETFESYFGFTPGAGSGSGGVRSVPEPTAFILGAFALGMLGFGRNPQNQV